MVLSANKFMFLWWPSEKGVKKTIKTTWEYLKGSGKWGGPEHCFWVILGLFLACFDAFLA